MTRARLFSKGLGGGGANVTANINLADLLPFLTTANVKELTGNVYFTNVRAFANLQLASINDLLDTDTANVTLGDALVWTGNIWAPGLARANLKLSTTDDLPQGSNNFYFSNALARRAFTAGNPTIEIDWNLGTISANLQAVAASANTTDSIPEGFVNLYYRDSRVHANLKLARLSDLYDVIGDKDTYPAGHPNVGIIVDAYTGDGLFWHSPSNSWIVGPVIAQRSAFATFAEQANTVLRINNFNTDNLAEGSNNLYFSNHRVVSNVEQLSINILADVNTAGVEQNYVLTWVGSQWVPRALGNISNINLTVTANFANTAGLANVANFALLANVANVALRAAFAETANSIASLGNFTTSDISEGANLYYTNARVLSNVEQMSINVLSDVNTTNVSVGTGIGYVLTWTGSEWAPNALPGVSDSSGFAERSNVANTALRATTAVFATTANIANTVLTLSNFTTADLREAPSNLYYTTARLRNDIQSAILNKDLELGDLILNGNLNVRGNLTLLNSDNILVKSRVITLASLAGMPSEAEGAGLYVAGANVGLRYSTVNNGWALDKDITINGNVLPAISGQYNIGQPGKLWRGIYIGAQTIFLGNTSISENPSGGLIVQDQFGNPAAIDLANIVGTEYVSVNRLLSTGAENQAYIGGNVKQFISGQTGNIYFGIQKDGTLNEFAGMRVVETRSPVEGNIRSDVLFYNDYENRNNSILRLGLLGDGNTVLTSNLIILNNINLIDRFGNFVGNAFLGTTDVAIEKGGTGANTRPNARRNLFSDFSGGLVAKIGGATNTLVATSIVAGTGVYVTDGDAQAGSPTIAIGQNVHPTASVVFSNVTVNGQLNSDDITAAVITARTDLIVQGNLTIRGNITTINSTTVTIDDKNLVLANSAINASQADGAGITINGANATINYASSGDKFVINKALDVQGNLTLGSGTGGNISGLYSVTAEQVNITGDKAILLASVSGSPTSNASLVVNRGSSPDVDLKWNESIDRWQFTNDGTDYFNIPRPEEYDNVIYDVSIQNGTTPALSANLVLNGRKSGNIISTDRIEIIGSGLVKVTRTNDDKLNIAAGVGTITVTNIDDTGNYVLDQLPTGTYRSAKYVYSALTTSYISGGPHHATGEILVLHDGANAYITQYAMLTSTDDDVVDLSADINSGNLRLLATASTGGHLVTLKLTGITYTEI
jgi:hypothetical protein